VPTPTSPTELQTAAAQWVARRNNGEHGAEDQRAFLHWLNASEANREAYDKAETLWEQMRDLDDIAGQQLADARTYLKRNQRHPTGRQFAALAATFLISASAVWYSDLLSHLDDQTYRTALGERRKIDLADGSQLELNTNSEVAVHYSRRAREVKLLRGQAVFTVVHDDHRPFDVLAGQGRIRDIGTQFDVRHIDDRVAVAVLDGEVEISVTKEASGRRLKRGMRLSYKPSGELTAPESIDIKTVSAWREGRLVFQNQPLGDVLEELGRYHRATLTITAPQVLDVKVSGVFPTDNLAQSLRTIATTLPIKLSQTGQQNWQIDPR